MLIKENKKPFYSISTALLKFSQGNNHQKRRNLAQKGWNFFQKLLLWQESPNAIFRPHTSLCDIMQKAP